MSGGSGHYSGWDALVLTVLFLVLSGTVLVLVHRALTMRRKLAMLLRERDVAFGFVHDVGDVFADMEDVDMSGLLQRVLFYALRTTRAAAGAAYLLDADREFLTPMAITGVFPPIVGGVDASYRQAFSKTRHIEQLTRRQVARVGEGLLGEAAKLNRAIVIKVAETDPRVPKFNEDFLTVHTILLVPMRFRRDVIGVLAVVNRVDGLGFTEGDRNVLQALADQASVSLHYAQLNAALHEKHAMDRDLLAASRIQSALLPKVLPRLPGADLAAFSVSAKQVGGDYYDVIEIDNTHVGLAIADVSGKSMSGAILMSVCRSLLRLVAKDCTSPRAALCRLNRMIAADLPEDMFITFLYVVLDRRTRRVCVARAGHVAPLVFKNGAGKVTAIESGGMGMGLMDPDAFDEALEEKRMELAPGDLLVAYTDGVTEAMDKAGSEWGELSLGLAIRSVMLNAEGITADRVLQGVRAKLMQFVGETPLYDDMTLVVLRLTEGSEDGTGHDEEEGRRTEYAI